MIMKNLVLENYSLQMQTLQISTKPSEKKKSKWEFSWSCSRTILVYLFIRAIAGHRHPLYI